SAVDHSRIGASGPQTPAAERRRATGRLVASQPLAHLTRCCCLVDPDFDGTHAFGREAAATAAGCDAFGRGQLDRSTDMNGAIAPGGALVARGYHQPLSC